MNKIDALVVVDMQPDFEAANCEKTINGVVKLTKNAVDAGKPVFVLEYDFGAYRPTHDFILDIIKNSAKSKVIKKKADGGQYHIAAALQDDSGIWGLGRPERYKLGVCGVNLNACVRDTAIGLKKLGFNVLLYKEATNQPKWYGSVEEVTKIYSHFKESGVVLV